MQNQQQQLQTEYDYGLKDLTTKQNYKKRKIPKDFWYHDLRIKKDNSTEEERALSKNENIAVDEK